MKILLLLLLCTTPLLAQAPINGYGVLTLPGQQLPLNIEYTDSAGTLQSPVQSMVRIPFTSVRVTADSVRFTVNNLGLRFTGRRYTDSLVGTFSQTTFTAPLTFYPDPPEGYAAAPRAPKQRFQEPTDFPYQRDPTSFPGGAEDVTLAGELTYPTDTAPKAWIVLVTGSGAQDRDEYLAAPIEHRPFLVISDYLTRHGYGVLRYDDRGVGGSTGDFSASTSADFALDAAAAVRYLRETQDTSLPIGILGHSEGGMIGPMVAADSGSVDFLVLLAGPGIRIDSLMTTQRRMLTGSTPPDEAVHQALYAYIREHTEQPDSAFAVGAAQAVVEAIDELPEPVRGSITDTTAFIGSYLAAYQDPWMRYFIAFDPGPYLERVSVPVLAINGELDLQVSPQNLGSIGVALDRAGNQDATLVHAPGLNHLLQPAKTGMVSEYGEIETTIDPSILRQVVDWLDERY